MPILALVLMLGISGCESGPRSGRCEPQNFACWGNGNIKQCTINADGCQTCGCVPSALNKFNEPVKPGVDRNP